MNNEILILIKDKIKDEYNIYEKYQNIKDFEKTKNITYIIKFLYAKHYKLLVMMQSAGVNIDLKDFISVNENKILKYINDSLDEESHFLNSVLTASKFKKYVKLTKDK